MRRGNRGKLLVSAACIAGLVPSLAGQSRPVVTLNPPAAGASELSGRAYDVDVTTTKVVIYALTNEWYVQPLADAPFTDIAADGSWSSSTYPRSSLVVLLVNPADYTPAAKEITNPALDPGVLAWTQYPSGPVSVNFSDRTWGIKVTGSTPGDQFDPGPNFWSNDPSVVNVAPDGLHLKITQINGIWQSGEVYLLNSLGYGTYTAQARSYLNNLDLNTVAAPLFIYAGVGEELDNEYSGTGGLIPSATSVFATEYTDVVLDINGYFVSNADAAASVFYPMTPCRLVDTRPGAPSTIITGSLAAGSTTTLPVLSSGCGVPATAQAYSLNFTTIPSNGTLGYLTVYPAGVPQPPVSTLNAPTGTVVANAAIVPAGASGSINAYVTDTTDLVVDINGYFAPPGTGGLSFYPVFPCRVLDSRNPTGTPPLMGATNVNVIGSGCASASAAQAYVFNATVVPPAPLGYLTLWPEGNTQPVVSTLNALDASITSNMAIVPANGNTISAFASDATYLILDTSGYFAP